MSFHYRQFIKMIAPRSGLATKTLQEAQGSVDALQSLLKKADNEKDIGMSFSALLMELIRQILDRETYSYTDLVDNGRFADPLTFFGQLLHPEGDPANLNAQLSFSAVLHYQLCAYEIAGKHTYEVSSGLAEQLRATTLKGVNNEDLTLPYESQFVVIPKTANLYTYNDQSGWHRVVGAYLTQERTNKKIANFSSPDKSAVIGHSAGTTTPYRVWRVVVVGEDKAFAGDAVEDDAINYFRVELHPGKSVEDAVNAAQETFDSIKYDDPNSLMIREWKNIFYWLMNFSLYVTHVEPGEHWIADKEARQLWDRIEKLPKKSPKKKRLRRRFASLDPELTILLGQKIKVSRRKGGKSNEHQSATGPQTALKVARRVPGHWRRVVHGPKGMLRRWQWIAPYWRNKDGIKLSGDTHLAS